jgi:hypothetical protein
VAELNRFSAHRDLFRHLADRQLRLKTSTWPFCNVIVLSDFFIPGGESHPVGAGE